MEALRKFLFFSESFREVIHNHKKLIISNNTKEWYATSNYCLTEKYL